MKALNLTGQKFGKLTVIKPAAKRGSNRYWLCQCDCGSEPKEIRQSHLRSGAVTSCSCSKNVGKNRLNLTDRRFGKLTVIAATDQRKNGQTVWYCRCDCGKQKYVQTTYLTTGDTQSCGCYKKQNEPINLRDQYEDKRVDGVVKPLFKGKEPRKDSGTGYRGVSKYYTRKSKELRYRAWITVAGERKYKSGFLTAEDAYYKGRLWLEQKYLPKGDLDSDE